MLVAASSITAAGEGVNWYLKYYCNQLITHSGSNISPLKNLPEIKTQEWHVSWAHKRFAFNYCTFNYTMSFWKWKQWEKELDRMALNGVNMSLAIIGMEEVWYNVLKKQQILTDGIQEEPPPERKGKRGREKKSKGLNLIIRMQTNMDAVLLYAFDPEVPFTNNQAERDFRFSKVKMNVSHCFRSTDGATHHARIMSVISTARKHNMNKYFEGKSFCFSQQAS